MLKNKSSLLFLSVLILFYCFDYYLRISPSIIINELMHQYHTNASGMGLVASAFYIGYTIMQLPAGVILDRYSLKPLMVIAILFTCFAFMLFLVSDNLWLGISFRLLVGFGSGLSFIGVLFFAKKYCPNHWFSFIAGLTIALGTLSATAAQGITAFAIQYFPWKELFLIISLSGCLIAFILSVIPWQETATTSHHKNIIKDIKILAANKKIWFCGIVGGLFYIPTTLLSAVWGINFMEAKFGVNKTEATFAIMCLFMGWSISSPIVGGLIKTHDKMLRACYTSAILAMITSSFILFADFDSSFLYVALFFMGIFSGAQVTIWGLFNEHIHHDFAGRGTAMVNMIITFTGAIGHMLAGILIDFHHGHTLHLTPKYLLSDYQTGLVLLPISFLLAAVISYYSSWQNSIT